MTTSVSEQLIIDTDYWLPIVKQEWLEQIAMDRGVLYTYGHPDDLDYINTAIEEGRLTPAGNIWNLERAYG